MNKKFNVIKLAGLKGLFLIVFLVGCLATGLLVFPGWVCMHAWNFAGSFFLQMPQMNIVHGVVLWCIIGLSIYAINKNNFWISFNSVSSNEERLKKMISEEPLSKGIPMELIEADQEKTPDNIEENKLIK